MDARWVCLDVGETIIDETRIWGVWADVLGIPRLTFMAAFGAGIERGGQYSDVFGILERDDWREYQAQVDAAFGGFQEVDLYPDARRSIDRLRAAGLRLAIVANQPTSRTAELRALGIDAEVMAMSDEMGVAKPDPAFFERALDLMGRPAASDVAYVGDRLDNDVGPAHAAGMRAVWLRRGPWALLRRDAVKDAALIVDSLDELAARIGECWA